MENIIETRTYQFLLDRDAPASSGFSDGVRERWAWADSQGGVKELRMMTRCKMLQFSTFVVQTWRRQWIDDGAGGGIALPPSATATQHRTATTNNISFAGDVAITEPYVAWIAGEYPGHPTFDLTAFEAAVTAGDTTTVSSMASNWPGVKADLPSQSQYRWHRFRWQPAAPTWGEPKQRMLGYSERINSQNMFCPLGWSARVFTTTESDDREINYPYALPTVLEREHTTPTHMGETVRSDSRLILTPMTQAESQSSATGYEVANFTSHPLSDVPAIATTEKYDRLRMRVLSRTPSAAMTITPIISDALWAWRGFQTRIGTAVYDYWTVEPRIRLSRVYGPYGQADGALRSYAWGEVPGLISVWAGGQYTYWMMYYSGEFPVPVEGWHVSVKPTVSPSPIVLSMTNPVTFVTAAVTIDGASGDRTGLFVASLVTGSNNKFLPKNLRVRIERAGSATNIFNISAEHEAMNEPGSFSFTVRAFSGNEYSDPIPVTVNVLPPPPP